MSKIMSIATINTNPIELTVDNFASIIQEYFPVEQNEDIACLLHVKTDEIDKYLDDKLRELETRDQIMKEETDTVARLKSLKHPVDTLKLQKLKSLGEDVFLVPYSSLNRENPWQFEKSYNTECTQEDVDLIAESIKQKLTQQRLDMNRLSNSFVKLEKLPANFFSYESNEKYVVRLRDYINNCRFTNVENYFKMAESIFSNQFNIYKMFELNPFMLITGGTGVGKTAVIPLLYYHYMRSGQISNRGIWICEPRISTTKNPYQFLRLNTGSDFKFSFNDIDKIFKEKYGITEGIIANKSDYIERVYNGFESIQMVYRGHRSVNVNNRFINTKITFMTDGIFYNRLIHKPKSVLQQALIVIDEVHESSLNSLIGLAILAAYRDIDKYKAENTDGNSTWENHPKVMLITAMCQPKEKKIFNNLLPGLFEYDKLPNTTKYTTTEIQASPGSKIDNYIKPNKNGLLFLSTEKRIDEFIQNYVNKAGILLVKLTRNTNIYEFNGDVTRYLKSNAINKSRNYLVMATNVAESSITFPDLDYVIDMGLQLSVEYDVYNMTFQVKEEPMTRNSRIQRVGRVGRTRDGEYIYFYNTSNLIAYKNRMETENLSPIIRDIVCTFKDADLRGIIIEKLKKSFECEKTIDMYISHLCKIGWIDANTESSYAPTTALQSIYKLKQQLKKAFIRKSKERQLIEFSFDITDIKDENSEDDEVENDNDTQNAETGDAEFQIVCMLYYCNIEQIRKLLILTYTSRLTKLLNSEKYIDFIRNLKRDNINMLSVLSSTKSDIIPLLKYLQSYEVPELPILNNLISSNSFKQYIPVITAGDDIDAKVFDAISKSLYLTRQKGPRSEAYTPKYSRMSSFNEAYKLELTKKFPLLHSCAYVRDYYLKYI